MMVNRGNVLYDPWLVKKDKRCGPNVEMKAVRDFPPFFFFADIRLLEKIHLEIITP